jgi:hypothetical protein
MAKPIIEAHATTCGDCLLSEDVESIVAVDWDIPWKEYPPKVVLLPSGERMVIREAKREEVPKLLKAIRPLLTVEKDFYDIVAARLYGEILGWYRHRARNEFVLVGIVDGKLAGISNNRAFDQKTHISLHTIALKRGARAGAHMFAAKQENSMENLGAEEILVTAESPIGFRRLISQWCEPRPGVQHELGGAKTWVITRDIYKRVKPQQVFGSRPVPDDLLKRSATFEIAPLDWVPK